MTVRRDSRRLGSGPHARQKPHDRQGEPDEAGEAAGADQYGRFVADPTPEKLEKFFFLDAAALKDARDKRRLHNRRGRPDCQANSASGPQDAGRAPVVERPGGGFTTRSGDADEER